MYLYDGGLPQDPQAPWRYQLTFHVNGLTNEYDGDATFIRDGRLVQVPTFTELETVEFPPLGTLEAFVISGSMSTTPHTHLGRLERYENKVLRYPGHFATFEAYKRLGLFSEEAIDVEGRPWCPASSTTACSSRRSGPRSSATCASCAPSAWARRTAGRRG